MSVLIKRMDMPKSCADCKLFGEYGCPIIGPVGIALTRGYRNEDCPLVEIKTGEWIYDLDNKGWSFDYPYRCDNCDCWSEDEFNYCPHCGARMEKWQT